LRQYHFVVYGTVTDQGHVEFYVDDETTDISEGPVYDNNEDWVPLDEDTKDPANFDLLRKSLKKRIRG
jgi:hypothetical protein